MENKKNNLILFIAIIVFLGALILSWYLFFKPQTVKVTDYIISNVPYVGIHNHKGLLSYAGGDTESAVTSILEYWNPGKNNLTEINRYFSQYRKTLITGELIINFINTVYDNYQVRRVNLNIDEIKNYINSQIRTPLFLFLSIDTDQPLKVVYHPASVLIGIKESEQKLVFHNFWLGNNYEITFNEFNNLQEKMRPDERNTYFVIQPKDFKEKLETIRQRPIISYPKRTSIMVEGETMFKNYGIASGAAYLSLNNIAIDYFSRVVNDAKFDSYFPPYPKVSVLYSFAEVYLRQRNIASALKYVQQAIELNYDLDREFKDWPGYEIRTNRSDIIDRISGPYRVLGDIYRELKDFLKAKEAYQKALEINPFNSNAQHNLQQVELELAKKK